MIHFDSILKNKPVVLIVGGIVILAIIVGIFSMSGTLKVTNTAATQVSVNDKPVNVALDFAVAWLSAWQSTTTNPYESGLATSTILSPRLRERIKTAQSGDSGNVIDPVVCQSATTSELRINARIMNEQPTKAQVLIMAKRVANQAIFTLLREGEGWYIDDITCAAGEFEPEREFSFEMEGNLLKNVPKPLDSQYWHLVFTEDGKPGHTAPLFFDAGSTCLAADGGESVCDPAKFQEAIKASVQGEMTETGVKVKKLKFLE